MLYMYMYLYYIYKYENMHVFVYKNLQKYIISCTEIIVSFVVNT